MSAIIINKNNFQKGDKNERKSKRIAKKAF